MTNRWNQFIYLLWSPVCDAALGCFYLPVIQGDAQALLVAENSFGAETGRADRYFRQIPAG